MTNEINTFVFGWRGLLVGTRRAWHAHQRPRLEGFRGSLTLAAPGGVFHGVKKLVTLVDGVLSRGGTLWGFGFGGPREAPWGRIYPVWRPGTLSNHLFLRLRKTHLLHRVARTVAPVSRRGRRRGSRLSGRWGRLLREGRRFGPPHVAPREVALAHVGVTLAAGATSGGARSLPQQPTEGYLRAKWTRRWWESTGNLDHSARGARRTRRPGGVTFSAGVTPGVVRRTTRAGGPATSTPTRGVRVAPRVGVEVAPRVGRPTGVVRRRHQRWWTPLGGRRFQTWPLPIPSVLVGGGWSPWGVTLVDEASSAGFLLVHLTGSDASPPVGVGVLWNQDPRSLAGVVPLVEEVWGRSFRVVLLQTLWGRLSLVTRAG